MSMKVLMAPVNIAGQPIAVTNELRCQGVDVTLLQYTAGGGHAFGYESDRIVDLKGRHRVEAQAETLESVLAEGYDIFHFWMSTLFGGRRYRNMYGFDLPFIKARGRRIVYRGTGFDLRVRSQHIARNPHHAFQYGYQLEIDEEAQLRYLEYLKSYVDLFIVQDPEMHEFMPQARVVPRGIDVEAVAPVGIEPNERPLVVHAPSKTLVKGTAILENALAELAEEGVPFDFKLITGMEHEEAMDWYRRADVVVDQLLIGWYGVLTIEALALGKPVVAYVRDDLYEKFTPRIPVANANPATIKDVLRPLLSDYEARRELAEAGPEFVREVHDIRKVASALREIYAEVMETPVRQPEGYADIQHFVAQFHAVEELEQRKVERFGAAKFEELKRELPRLRFKANKHDELAETVRTLRAQVRALEAVQAQREEAAAQPAAPGSAKVPVSRRTLRGMRERALEYDAISGELPGLRFKANKYDELAENVRLLKRRIAELESTQTRLAARTAAGSGRNAKVSIDRQVLRDLHSRASEYDAISAELPRLQYQARRSEELFKEVQGLRYKAARHDELRDEVLELRYRVKQLESGPRRFAARLFRRLSRLAT